jgi:hypothetical protein
MLFHKKFTLTLTARVIGKLGLRQALKVACPKP